MLMQVGSATTVCCGGTRTVPPISDRPLDGTCSPPAHRGGRGESEGDLLQPSAWSCRLRTKGRHRLLGVVSTVIVSL
jgi:hypothetical protein